MMRLFEFDDYPRGRRPFLRLVDSLVKKYPNFKCNVFAIPAEMTPRSFREIAVRPFLRLNPHGFVHGKRECRERIPRSKQRILTKLAEDDRWSFVFKAPWHGYCGSFVAHLHERGFVPAMKSLSRMPYPMPTEWKMYNSCDLLMASRADGIDDVGQYLEVHPVYPRIEGSLIRKAYVTEISRHHMQKWTRSWKPTDDWGFVEDFVRPACLKLHLGCGVHVWDGWQNLDPRDHLDERIIKWDFSKQIPFAECKADIAFTSHVFNYVEEAKYEEALLDIWRVLRPGGVLRMAEDCTDSGYVWRQPGQAARHTGVIRSLPTKAKIVAALRRVGFKIYDAEPGQTRSPHKDVLHGDSRPRRYKRGHKFYIEAVKEMDEYDLSRMRRWDMRATRWGRYRLPQPKVRWHRRAKRCTIDESPERIETLWQP